MDQLTPVAPLISAKERARREEAVRYGRGTVRLEGFTVSAEAEALNQRYIEGELTSEELTAAILELHRV